MEFGAGAGVGLRVASSAFGPLIKRLFRSDPPGAGLVDKPVRVSSLVSFRGEKRTLTEADLRKLSEELIRRAVRDIGPHDAPSEDELIEVAVPLSRSLLSLGELDMDDVQAVRLGHEKLARMLAVGNLRGAWFPAYDFYLRLLDQCCLHILNFFTQRSTFVARTLVEQSRQLDQVIAKIDLLAERIGHQSAEDAEFEERYAAYIQQEHSRLTIYGLDLNEEREWPLDDAYLSLELQGRDREALAAAAPPQRAERALAGQERVLLRGLAGSGKTTLVQWLAVVTARQDAAEGMRHLLGRVPFVLPMRTLTRDGAPLPSPERFLAAVGCPLAGAQPDRWTDRVFQAGRALLLVDGIDEIPEAEREGVRTWVRRLKAAYPRNLWLITARPSAVAQDWLGGEDFTELALAPMNGADVRAFVHRWHRAAGVGDETENALLGLIRSRTDLGTLATNPLMCAMICALHRERNRYLPRGRKALYDAALMMLLERRDRERPDPLRGCLGLDAETQISLLQKLAYWLINNGRSEMAKDVAVSQIGQALPLIHQGGELGPPGEVLRHLVERSGVLREPAPGAVDFVHRTFQDYLGAREIVEWQHFPALVDKAHEDQWEDVVRMAVAHAQPVQRGDLLTALVERGDQDEEHRVRLHLLATACLEQATQLPPEVRAAVESRARRFIPPRNLDEALTLVHAGPVVLELLPGPEKLTDEEAYAVVVTATQFPSDAALGTLRAFRRHPSLEVRRQLAYAWGRFDTESYFHEIVSHLPRGGPLMLSASGRERLQLLGTLDGLSHVELRGDFTEEDILTALGRHPIAGLSLQHNRLLRDLGFLSRFRRLSYLSLNGCHRIDDISSLACLPLQELRLYNTRGGSVTDQGTWTPRGIGALSELRSLDIGGNVRPELPRHAPLERLTVSSQTGSLSEVATWPTLKSLVLSRLGRNPSADEWRTVAGLPNLRHIVLDERELSSLRRSGVRMPHINVAELYGKGGLAHLVECLPGLGELILWNDPADFAPLARLPELRSIRLYVPSDLRNVPPHVEVTVPPRPRY